MATNILPGLNKLLISSFFTLSKGVKMGSSDFTLTRTYDNIYIDENNLKKYNDFFGIKSPLPISYLYLVSQRSQLAVMNDRSFPLPVMGLVHIGNIIEMLGKIDTSKPLKLETTAFIAAKEEGSLFPKLNVNLYQNNVLIAKCSSDYIAKRKRKVKKEVVDETIVEPVKKTPVFTQTLKFAKNLGRIYAKISGDYNPIHTIPLFAKNAGFKSVIIHGWYSVSKLSAIIESERKKEVKYIQVDFKKPITLPNTVDIELYNNEDSSTGFMVKNKSNEICLEGSMS